MSAHEITQAFLIVALAAYTLFGGADFGGGLLEASLRRHPGLQKTLQSTLAPVWEANHVWLIAVIVILFVGFPVVYARLSTLFFVPLSLALLGIACRGAFFTFRKYDPEPGARSHWYGWLFRAGSFLAPAFFGCIVGALLQPLPHPVRDAGLGFVGLYAAPWATWMGLLCTVFVNVLFAYLAAVFFYGEVAGEEDRRIVRRRILFFLGAAIVSGGLVLTWGALADIVPLEKALNPVQLGAQGIALLAIPWLLASLRRERVWGLRAAAGAQVLAILTGWFSTQYPAFLSFRDGTRLTAETGGAPPVTLFWLNVGLVAVLAAVVPLLVVLYRVFARAEDDPTPQ